MPAQTSRRIYFHLSSYAKFKAAPSKNTIDGALKLIQGIFGSRDVVIVSFQTCVNVCKYMVLERNAHRWWKTSTNPTRGSLQAMPAIAASFHPRLQFEHSIQPFPIQVEVMVAAVKIG
jgi:hypothetical protein